MRHEQFWIEEKYLYNILNQIIVLWRIFWMDRE